MGIKQSNPAALLDFPNVIRPNESNSDRETSQKCPHVSERGKVFLGPMESRGSWLARAF